MKNNIDSSTKQQSPSSSTNSLTQATAQSLDQPLIHVNNVHKSYPMGTTTVQALRGVNLQIQKGEFTALIGTSGSGKSTLLNLIGCLDDADSGQVLIDGIDINTLSEKEKSFLRNHKLGFIFQSFNLIPVLNVAENVEMPLIIRSDLSKNQRLEMVMSALKDVGLDTFSHHLPDQLSGGQRQRVAIARSLVTQPSLILADEPTANLDSKTTHMIIDLLLDLNAKRKVTFFFCSHDEKLIGRVGRVVHISDGQITT